MPVRPPGVETPFLLYRNLLSGKCQYKDGVSWLEISVARADGDTRELPSYRNMLRESVGFGMHLVDYNIALEDLMDAVELRAAVALK